MEQERCDCSQNCPKVGRRLSFGLILEARSKFRDNVDCGMSVLHRVMGKFESTEHRPAIKWFFHVCIARSDALRR
jgi:hypothetical protein